MSIIGTGIAAGVAAANQTSREVQQRKDRQTRETEQTGREARDRFEQDLRAIEQQDEADTLNSLRVDEQVPQREAGHDLPVGPGRHQERPHSATPDGEGNGDDDELQASIDVSA